jgi:hypothetical protein
MRSRQQFTSGIQVIVARAPVDIISDVLFDVVYSVDNGEAIRADDVIDALEAEGWYLQWAPDIDANPTYRMRRIAA